MEKNNYTEILEMVAISSLTLLTLPKETRYDQDFWFEFISNSKKNKGLKSFLKSCPFLGDKNFIRTGVKLNNKFFNPKLVTELAANKLLCDGEIFDVYQDLQHRKLHPLGVFDNANRFFVNKDYSDLIDVRSPSRAWPNSENKACRSFEFCKKVVVKFKCKTKSDLLAHFTKKS